MKTLTAFPAFLLCAVLFASTLPAQTSGTGEVRGRVYSSSSGSYLNRVRLTVKGTSLETFTDSSGSFTLTRVPAGSAEVTATYTGLAPRSAAVTVAAGGAATLDFDLDAREGPGSAAVKVLDPFSVEAERMSIQAIALNEQRNAPNIKNVVSTDEFGDIGEGNLGEFVKFIPGVSTDYSANVGVGISIRGFPGSSTLITLDGGEVASSALDANDAPTRSPSLEGLRLNNISRVEVTKVPTPDVPANAQGGSVNVISKNGFERKNRSSTYRTFLTFNSRNFAFTGLNSRPGSRRDLDARPLQPGVKLSYEMPVNKQFAFTVSGGSVTRLYQYRSASTPWNLTNNVLSSFTLNAQEHLTHAGDAAITAEYRLGRNHVFRATGLYVDTVAYRSLNRLTIDFGTGAVGDSSYVQGSSAATGSGSFGNPATAQLNTKTAQLNLSYSYRRGPWRVDALASTARSRTNKRDLDQGFFNRVDLDVAGLIVRGEGLYQGMPAVGLPRAVATTDRTGRPIDLFDGGEYSLSRVVSRQSDGLDGKLNARADASREFGPLFTAKTGVALNVMDRDYRETFKRIDFRPTATAADRAARNYDLVDPVYSKTAQSYFPGHQVQWVSLEKLYQLYKAKPEYFILNETASYQGSVTPSKLLQEAVAATYFRGDLKLFDNRLWLVGGVRYEKTMDKGWGPSDEIGAIYKRDANGALLRDEKGALIFVSTNALERQKLRFTYRGAYAEKEYDGWYPSFNSSFNLTPDLVARFAYARTLGRPNLGEIIPGQTIADPTLPPERRTITVVNTGLKPWTSDGFDLSLESYSQRGGIATIGVFRKNVRDFFGGVRVPVTDALLERYNIPESFPGEFAGYEIITKENVGRAQINGSEFSYKQSLHFLPGWGENLQFFANASLIKPTGSNAADFSRYSRKIYNWGLNFARGKVYARVNWNQRPGDLLEPIGTDPTAPKSWSTTRTMVSLDVEYRLSRRFSVYGTANNLTDAPEFGRRFSPSTPAYARINGVSVYGTDFTVGLKGSF